MTRPTSNKQRFSFKTRLITLILLVGISWSIGLWQFIELIPDKVEDTTTKTDAIVILTGGSNRLMDGVSLLQRGMADKLLISGVKQGVTIQHLGALSKEVNPNQLAPLENKITLGHFATDTESNATEAAIWMTFQDYHSLRLVTASYHMPRSLLQFHAAMPDIKVIPNPVFPTNFKLQHWWTSPGTLKLLVSEYNKYIVLRCLYEVGAYAGNKKL